MNRTQPAVGIDQELGPGEPVRRHIRENSVCLPGGRIGRYAGSRLRSGTRPQHHGKCRKAGLRRNRRQIADWHPPPHATHTRADRRRPVHSRRCRSGRSPAPGPGYQTRRPAASPTRRCGRAGSRSTPRYRPPAASRKARHCQATLRIVHAVTEPPEHLAVGMLPKMRQGQIGWLDAQGGRGGAISLAVRTVARSAMRAVQRLSAHDRGCGKSRRRGLEAGRIRLDGQQTERWTAPDDQGRQHTGPAPATGTGADQRADGQDESRRR